MATEKRRNPHLVKWIVLCAAVLVVALIAVGINMTREAPDAPADATSTPSSSDGMTSSDGGGSESPADATTEPSVDTSTDPSVADEPTEPPRDIAIDPQQSRPTKSPAVAPAPPDGSGVELEPVAPEVIVEAPNGAVVSLDRIEAVHGQANVGGEISGPAIRVSVAIRNDGTEPVDLEYVVVNAYSGADRAPAGSIMQPGGKPFAGSLAAGESAEGVYLFSIGESDRGDVAVTVDYGVGEPIVVFRGDLT